MSHMQKDKDMFAEVIRTRGKTIDKIARKFDYRERDNALQSMYYGVWVSIQKKQLTKPTVLGVKYAALNGLRVWMALEHGGTQAKWGTRHYTSASHAHMPGSDNTLLDILHYDHYKGRLIEKNNQDARRLVFAIRLLTWRQRKVVWLSYRGYSLRDIAKRLGISKGAASTDKARGIQTLSKILSPRYKDTIRFGAFDCWVKHDGQWVKSSLPRTLIRKRMANNQPITNLLSKRNIDAREV
jgi:DNA-binding CsgD family transcriptional regulator